MDKMHGLSIRDRSYALLYARCAHRFPEVARNIEKPKMSQSQSSSYAFQNPTAPTIPLPHQPPHQPWSERSAPVPPPVASKPTFLRSRCMFCSQFEHRIKECPIAHEYCRTGKAVVIGNQIHLPNGQPIPPNIIGRNLQEKIDAWIAGTVASAPTQPSEPTFVRETPPHATHSFEIVTDKSYGQPVQRAHIAEVLDSASEDEWEQSGDDEDPDIFEVYATERRKRAAKASQLTEFTLPKEPDESAAPTTATTDKTSTRQTPPKPASSSLTSGPSNKTNTVQSSPPPNVPTIPTIPSLPSSTSRPPPQYRYQSNAEDQRLTTELYRWFLEGTLTHITPAHILAVSPAIRKELMERLRTRRVETASLEESSSAPDPPLSVLELVTPRTAEYSLPLHEIDVLVNDTVTEAGMLDQGLQIIVIRQDLLLEAGASINPDHRLEMEGANGLVSKTLGCAENLSMQVGDVAFEVHAHVVERAPFRLLLGRPFHNLLLCRLEDRPDGSIDISVRNPADPHHSIIIPSRPRKALVGCVRALSFPYQLAPP